METGNKQGEIIRLLQQYGFNSVLEDEILFYQFCTPPTIEADKRRLVLAEMLLFFKAIGGEVKITGNVKHPRSGMVKGATLSYKFEDEELKSIIESHLDKLLFEDGNEEYKYIFEDGSKGHPVGYNEAELLAIVEYEKHFVGLMELTEMQQIGMRFGVIYNFMCKWGIAGDKGHPTMKEYSLLYDYAAIWGKFNNIGLYDCRGWIGKEKYDKVKNCIGAFKRIKGKPKKN